MSRARDNADLGNSYGSLGAGVTGGSGLTALGTVTEGTLNSTVTGDSVPMVKIGSASFSGVNVVDLGQTLGSYRVHKLMFTAQSSTTGGAGNIYLRVKIGGSLLDNGNKYAYVSLGMRSNTNTLLQAKGNDAGDYFPITRDSTRADSKSCFEITFHNAVKADHTGITSVTAGYQHDGAQRLCGTTAYCIVNDTGVVSDIRIYGQSYNLTGSWELYGLR